MQKARMSTIKAPDPIEAIVRATKTTVEVGVVFLKIGEIDTIKEQYSADIYVQARWREPLLDNKSPEDLKKVDFKEYWSPHLHVHNSYTEAKDTSWQSVVLNENGEAKMAKIRKLRGVFIEKLELETFPLDVQDLSITVVSSRPDEEIELVPDDEHPSCVNTLTFCDAQEWKLFPHIEISKKTVTIEYTHRDRVHEALMITCQAARRPMFYYGNVFLLMFFISSMAFATWAIDPKMPQSRLLSSLTLLLTSIAFKMAMNQSLPRISYLTYADKYVLPSIAFLILVCIWHSIVPTIARESPTFYKERTEGFVLLGFFLIYIIGHVAFISYVYIQAGRKRRETWEKQRAYCANMGIKKTK